MRFQKQFKNRGEWRIPQETTHVVGLQPDHPDRNLNLDKILHLFIKNKYSSSISLNSKNQRNKANWNQINFKNIKASDDV